MSMDNEHYKKLERMYSTAPINEFCQPELVVSTGRAELEFMTKEEFHHAAGSIHGSVYFKELDDAAYFAANSMVEDVFLLTANFNIHFLRPVFSGSLKAIGRVISQTRQVVLAEAFLYDQQGREVARGSGSFMRSKVELNDKVGYR